MIIGIIGSGGRAHCLAWKIAQSPIVDTVYVAPGNAGSAQEPGVFNVNIGAMDFDALIEFATKESIDLTVIGPEAPLVAGIVDAFTAAGLRCFGPDSKAARIEGSKSFAKDFLKKYDIPTGDYEVIIVLKV